MAVHIRLQRKGNTHRPFYHLVACDHRAARDGKFLEKLGYYNPNTEPSTMEINPERVRYWYGKGAQLSGQVSKLVKIKKIGLERDITKQEKK